MDSLRRLDVDQLDGWAVKFKDAYREANPFPHVVIDRFLDEDWLTEVEDEFPGPDDIEWWRFDAQTERKLGLRSPTDAGPATLHLLHTLNSAVVIDFLTDLTGIEGLVPDPHFYGAGLHQIQPGGFLKIHADFNLHPRTRLERRLNLLLYLNRDWASSFGGALELWDRDMLSCRRSIEPVWNRCVVFDTSSTSYHGHPDPLTCPPGRTRKSVSVYYYSAASRATIPHNTLFRDRAGHEDGVHLTAPAGPLHRRIRSRFSSIRSRE
jgi:hypothetical protein